jgi:hypothetical protein
MVSVHSYTCQIVCRGTGRGGGLMTQPPSHPDNQVMLIKCQPARRRRRLRVCNIDWPESFYVQSEDAIPELRFF